MIWIISSKTHCNSSEPKWDNVDVLSSPLLLRCLTIFLIIFPALISVVYIKLYGENVCFWDEWILIPLFEKLRCGNLTITDLFVQHNEHRIFFPKLLMLLLGVFTSYNTKVEMYVGWLFLCLIAFMLWQVYKICIRQHSPPLAFILISWLVFSLRQWENLLWGWQIQIFMSVFFLLLALYMLERSNKLDFYFVVSVLSGIISSFSFANGLLVWPIGLLQLFWQYKFRQGTFKSNYVERLLVWTITSSANYVIYFWGYIKPAHHPSIFFLFQHPVFSICYFLAVIGGPLAVEKYTAMAMGILLLCLYMYVTFRLTRETATQSFFPVGMIFFTILSAIVLTFARSGFGVEQALSSRYTTVATLGVIGLYLLILSVTPENKRKWFLLGGLLVLILLGEIVSYLQGIKIGSKVQQTRRTYAYYLQTYRFQSDDQLPKIVREWAQILEKYNLNVFSKARLTLQSLVNVGSTTFFSIDSINDHSPTGENLDPVIIHTDRKNSITVTGWAVDDVAKDKAGGVFINIDDQLDIPALYGLDRPDVAEHFKNKRYRFSGFAASFSTSILEKGRHTLSLKIVTTDKKGYYVSNKKILLEIK